MVVPITDTRNGIANNVDYGDSPRDIFPMEVTYESEDDDGEASFYREMSIRINEPVGSMSISPWSRDVVLAARMGLFIIDLENPYETPRLLRHLTKWEVADVQWNPHKARDVWIASTSNQKALVWNLCRDGIQAIEHILHGEHGHTRAISDINWSLFDPYMLATCSVDTYVHLWDLRTPTRPVQSFSAWTAGATQVKFNKKSEFLLASAHDTDVKIWDQRKGSLPITNIKAHTTKIYGIDWSRTSERNIITCSLDKLVKYWDVWEPNECQGILQTNSPVWRARYSPFGDGVLTMPQRMDNNLYLWNYRESTGKPAQVFSGHTDTVKEFVWRVRGGYDSDVDDREFQLVSWSKDRHLRLWPITDETYRALNYVKQASKAHTASSLSNFSYRRPPPLNDANATSPSPAESTLRVLAGNRLATMSPLRTPVNSSQSSYTAGPGNSMYKGRKFLSPLAWMQNIRVVKPAGDVRVSDTGAKSHGLAEEISTLVHTLPNVKFEDVNVSNRKCTISLYGPWSDSGIAFLRVHVTFPAQYPERPASFDIQKTGMISMVNRAHLEENLSHIAAVHASERRPCLEACIRYLLGESQQKDELMEESDDDLFMSRKNTPDEEHMPQGRDDQNVPFPRMCGATFSAEGYLVCFFSPIRMHGKDTKGAGVKKTNGRLSTSPAIGFSNYTHSRSFESYEAYKALSRWPQDIHIRRSARIGGGGGGGGESEADSVEEYEEDEEARMLSLIFKPKDVVLSGKMPGKGSRKGLRDMAGENSAGGRANLGQRVTSINAAGENSSGMSMNHLGFAVVVHNLKHWTPFSADLARKYTLLGDDPVQICMHNASVAKQCMRSDLERVWNLAALILMCQSDNSRSDFLADPIVSLDRKLQIQRLSSEIGLKHNFPKSKPNEYPAGLEGIYEMLGQAMASRKTSWGGHPFGRKLVNNLLAHFTKLKDVQTLAMLSCVFMEPFVADRSKPENASLVEARSSKNTRNSYMDYIVNKGADRQQHPQVYSGNTSAILPSSYAMQMLPTPFPRTPNPGVFPFPGSGPSTPTQGMSESISSQRSSYFAIPVSGSPATGATGGGSGSGMPSGGGPGSPSAVVAGQAKDLDQFMRAVSATTATAMAQGMTVAVGAEHPSRLSSEITNPHPIPSQRPSVSSSASRKTDTMYTGMGVGGIGGSSGSSPPIWMRPTGIGQRVDAGGEESAQGQSTVKVYKADGIMIEFVNTERFDEPWPVDVPLLDPMQAPQLDASRLFYAGLLYQWGLLEARAELLKFVSVALRPSPKQVMLRAQVPIVQEQIPLQSQLRNEQNQTGGITFDWNLMDPSGRLSLGVYCQICQSSLLHPNQCCPRCQRGHSIPMCSICLLPARGLTSFCLRCGHGGHAQHMRAWFEGDGVNNTEECPAACGCQCGKHAGGIFLHSDTAQKEMEVDSVVNSEVGEVGEGPAAIQNISLSSSPIHGTSSGFEEEGRIGVAF
ncbi:uncharacterized protein VTP21DRAFT_46 [Calcarisporiella thermophila]|uniref:uncharacterized protein n=1 Tax=Calcarisporiella thermophila TaxID=911321 RepID=UPI0037423C76